MVLFAEVKEIVSRHIPLLFEIGASLWVALAVDLCMFYVTALAKAIDIVWVRGNLLGGRLLAVLVGTESLGWGRAHSESGGEGK